MIKDKNVKSVLVQYFNELNTAWRFIDRHWQDEFNKDYPFKGSFDEMQSGIEKWTETCLEALKKPAITLDEFKESRRRFSSVKSFRSVWGDALDDIVEKRDIECIFGYVNGFHIIKYKGDEPVYMVYYGSDSYDFYKLEYAEDKFFRDYVTNELN